MSGKLVLTATLITPTEYGSTFKEVCIVDDNVSLSDALSWGKSMSGSAALASLQISEPREPLLLTSTQINAR